MSLFAEIRRRKVFQVAAVYAVVAWLIVQVVSTIEQPLNLPEWFATVVIVSLASGFPVVLILAWAFDVTPQGIKPASTAAADAPLQPTVLRFGYISQALILLAVGFLVIDQYVLAPNQETSVRTALEVNGSAGLVRRYSIILGPTAGSLGPRLNTQVALSPDGRRLVYAAQVDGRRQLYLRELDQMAAQALNGTDGALDPSFSPDGEWVVFRTEQELRRISIRGGLPQSLASAGLTNTGILWTPDDSILFTTLNRDNVYWLHSIPALGGTPEPLPTNSDGFDATHSWPHVLPGGEHMLYTIRRLSGTDSTDDGRIAIMSLETGASETLIERAYNARFAPTGHIVFVRSATLWAVPFDIERLEITGREVPIVSGVETRGDRGASAYAFSNDGLLVYLAGGDITAADERHLVWVDRQGVEEAIPVEPKNYRHPRLSPDQSRLAVNIRERGNDDVWIIDLASGVPTRLTTDPAVDFAPLWTPDGQRIVFHSERDGGGMFWKSADGTGQVQRLTTSATGQYPESFSPDGEQLVFRQDDQSLYVLSMEDGATSPLISNPYQEHFAAISPDGRYVAYESHQNGPGEIYVRPFPNVGDGGPWPVSTGGGSEPRWNPQGSEIFYNMVPGGMAVTRVSTTPAFSVETTTPLLADEYVRGNLNEKPNYDIAADGQRLVLIKPTAQAGNVAGQTVLTVVDNWFEELNRLAPPAQ